MQTHRQNAKRKTVIWQGAAVAVLAVAGAAIAFPGVKSFLAPPPAPKKMVLETGPKTSETVSRPLSMGEAVDSLKRFSNFQPQPPAPVATATPEPTILAPPVTPPSEWAYLGSIITSTSRSALVKVDNVQQILSTGVTFHDSKLKTVEPDYIEVEKDGATKRIDLAPRTALTPNEQPRKQVAFKSTPTAGPAGNGAPMAMNTANAGAPSPATFEQARMAALAAREAVGRAVPQAPQQPGQPIEIAGQKISQEQRDEALKNLMEMDLPLDARGKFLPGLGIRPGMPTEQALAIAQKMGLDPNSDAGKATLEAIRVNSTLETKEFK